VAADAKQQAPQDRSFFSLWFVFLALALPAFGVLGYQTYAWFAYGQWIPVSVITVLQYAGCTWAVHPNEWLGIYKLFRAIPFSIFCLFFFASLWAAPLSTSGAAPSPVIAPRDITFHTTKAFPFPLLPRKSRYASDGNWSAGFVQVNRSDRDTDPR